MERRAARGRRPAEDLAEDRIAAAPDIEADGRLGIDRLRGFRRLQGRDVFRVVEARQFVGRGIASGWFEP
jgi:hypothetical protein